MKKLHFLALQLVAAALVLTSCGTHDSAEDDIKWSDDNGGTLEVQNNSSKDMVLFIGQVPMPDDILGGVRSGKSKKIDIGSHVSDFRAGGYAIIRGITRDEYNAKKYDLNNAKWEFNAMATYRAGTMYRITIELGYTGDNVVRLTNKAKVGVELRKNSPEGEKVAYLPALAVNQYLYTQTTETITLFPVYVFYNPTNQEVSTLKATSMDESVSVSPRSASDNRGILTYYFPYNEEDAWIQILKSLKTPVAYIKVTNNMGNQSVYFTNAGSTWLYSQEGYDAIGPGETLVFEVKASDYECSDPDEGNTECTGGQRMNLMATYSGGTRQISVRFNDKDGEIINELPLIKNGYNYNVSIEPDLKADVSNSYKAIITEINKRSLAEDIAAL